MRLSPIHLIPLLFAFAFIGFAADTAFTSYASARPVIEAYRGGHQPGQLPGALAAVGEASWNTWVRTQDKVIRARLAQGDLDSMVNLLLFGTSFTKEPRIRVAGITQASRSGTLRARVDDLVTGLRDPGNNERLVFLAGLLRASSINAQTPAAGIFILQNLQRVLQERKAIAERAAEADPATVLDRASLFSDRGVSLDTSILPDFSIEQTLLDLKRRGVLREGQVTRVAVVGPGLDFIDKNEESGYDYYPQQTLQPFALYDSLLRLGLAKDHALSVSILDISARVIDHVRRARDRARRNTSYVVQLPRDVSRPWPPDLISYWRSFGDRAGVPVPPIAPPVVFQGLETRAVRIRPEVVLACEPVDLNIVLGRINLVQRERFDLVIGTNIFIYYGAFEQSLALENVGAMLKSGGLLLTNDKLPEFAGGSMKQAGMTIVQYDQRDPKTREAVGWYQKR